MSAMAVRIWMAEIDPDTSLKQAVRVCAMAAMAVGAAGIRLP